MVIMIPFHTTRPAFTLRSISGYLVFKASAFQQMVHEDSLTLQAAYGTQIYQT